MTVTTPVVLASASPRRRQLLEQIGVACQVLPVDIDESRAPGEMPQDYVQRLALEKAQRGLVLAANPGLVLGSDTVVLVDGHILGKPVDRDHGLAMLSRLSGRQHQVLTAVAMVDGHRQRCLTSTSYVYFAAMSRLEMQAYWDTGEPADKAEGYAIQGMAAQFITRLDGSYSGVMGLPLYETAQLLKEFGIVTLMHE